MDWILGERPQDSVSELEKICIGKLCENCTYYSEECSEGCQLIEDLEAG